MSGHSVGAGERVHVSPAFVVGDIVRVRIRKSLLELVVVGETQMKGVDGLYAGGVVGSFHMRRIGNVPDDADGREDGDRDKELDEGETKTLPIDPSRLRRKRSAMAKNRGSLSSSRMRGSSLGGLGFVADGRFD